MKLSFIVVPFVALHFMGSQVSAQNLGSNAASEANPYLSNQGAAGKNLYIDVHRLKGGKVSYQAVAAAHAKDLAVESKYGVQIMRYWVDTARGMVYCLASSSNPESITKTHAEAHGLLPDQIYQVTGGTDAATTDGRHLFLDVHELGAGHVTASDAAAAHQKDLAIQNKYGVNFINYWVNEKEGIVMCLAEAADAGSIISAHKEAHGLIPKEVREVQQGQ